METLRMAEATGSELKAIVARVRSEQKGRFPKTLQGRLLRYAAERWKSGKTLREVAEELGISGHTLSYWRAQLLAKDESAFKPIKVVADLSRTFTVSGGSHARVEGLTMDEVAELLRKLA